MKRKYATLLLVMITLNLAADDIDSLYGIWNISHGTAREQKAAELSELFLANEYIDSTDVGRVSSGAASEAWLKYLYAEHLYYAGKFSEAFETGNEALSLCETAGDRSLLSDCLSIASLCCQRKGNFTEAISYLNKCYEIDSESGDDERLSSTLNSLAGLYLAIREPDTAKGYILKSIGIERRLQNRKALAVRYGMASEIYLKLNRPDSALIFISEAYKIDSEDHRDVKAAVRLSQMSEVYRQNGQMDSARICLDKAVPVLRRGKSWISLAISLNAIGDIEYDSGDLESAKKHYSEALLITDDRGCDYLSGRALKGLWRCSRENHPGEALQYLERAYGLQEVMFREDTEKAVAGFKVKYEAAEREKELIQSRNELNIRKRNIVILSVVLVFSGVLLCLLSLLLISQRRRMRLLKAAANAKDNLLSVIPNIKEEKAALEAIADELDTEIGPVLTRREKEIFKCCSQGLQAKEIAAKLGVSVRTVDTHKANIFRKLEINNVAELVRYAMEHKLHK